MFVNTANQRPKRSSPPMTAIIVVIAPIFTKVLFAPVGGIVGVGVVVTTAVGGGIKTVGGGTKTVGVGVGGIGVGVAVVVGVGLGVDVGVEVGVGVGVVVGVGVGVGVERVTGELQAVAPIPGSPAPQLFCAKTLHLYDFPDSTGNII